MKILLKHKNTLVGFGCILVLGIAARWLSGVVYSAAEAQDLIASLSRSALYLGSAIATSSATTIALMLTIVGLVNRLDQDFDVEFFQRITLISKACAVNLMGAIALLMIVTMPVGEFDRLPDNWYSILYDLIFWMVVLLCALSVSIVLILLRTIVELIHQFAPSVDS